MDLLVWNGEEHVPINWELFKYLCSINGYSADWEMDRRINWIKRLEEVLKCYVKKKKKLLNG